jgi:Flp pilus assembly CpaF family ATPase
MNHDIQSQEMITYFLNNGILPDKIALEDYVKKRWQVSSVPENILTKVEKTWNDFFSLTPLKELLSHEDVNEILIHSENKIQYEKSGKLFPCRIEKSFPKWNQSLARLLALRSEQDWNYSHPFQSFHLELEGLKYRITLLHGSLTANSIPKISIRKHKSEVLNLNRFALMAEQVQFFEKIVKNKNNVLICGSTSSGKTTFIRSLMKYIEDEHVVTIEDTHELLPISESQTCLLSGKNSELSDLCSYSLRLRPDRLILGEVRGKEIIPFFMSMNTGHRGLMSTIHADSGRDALKRAALLFSLYSAKTSISMEHATKLICQNIDFVVHLKNKRVSEILKVHGCQQKEPMVSSV